MLVHGERGETFLFAGVGEVCGVVRDVDRLVMGMLRRKKFESRPDDRCPEQSCCAGKRERRSPLCCGSGIPRSPTTEVSFHV